MKSKITSLFVTIGILCLAQSASAALVDFKVDLNGANEVPVGVGDPDGTGTGMFTFDSVGNTISWDIDVFDIAALTGLHIHNAPAGANGGVVVNLGALSGAGLFDADVASILANPTDFYVNVHTSEFPGGAIRGQFGKPVPDSIAGVWALAPLGLMFLARHRSKKK